MSATLDRLLAGTRADIDKLRAESADHARDASAIADQMTEPTDVLRAMEAEERDLVLKLDALRGAMKTARNALDAMADERDLHTRRADAAADAAEYYERTTLPHLAALLDGIPPAEALAATGLMPTEPMDGPQGDPFHPAADPFDSPCVAGEHARCAGCSDCPQDCHPDDVPPAPREPVATPPVPTEPAGELVAQSGPLVTQPDPGAAHPVPNPPAPLPPAQPGPHRHAKPGLGARVTGGFKALLDKPEPTDQQQGDDQ